MRYLLEVPSRSCKQEELIYKVKMRNRMMEHRPEKALTGMIPSLREVRDISHDDLGPNKNEVEPKLPTTLVVHFDDQGFVFMMVNVQYRTLIEVGHEQMYKIS